MILSCFLMVKKSFDSKRVNNKWLYIDELLEPSITASTDLKQPSLINFFLTLSTWSSKSSKFFVLNMSAPIIVFRYCSLVTNKPWNCTPSTYDYYHSEKKVQSSKSEFKLIDLLRNSNLDFWELNGSLFVHFNCCCCQKAFFERSKFLLDSLLLNDLFINARL